LVRALGRWFEVTAAEKVDGVRTREGVGVVSARRGALLREVRRHDAIVGPSIPPYALWPGNGCVRVADLYDPGELEMATVGGWRGRRHVARQQASRRLQLRWADVVLGANARQMEGIERDLEGIGRVTPPRRLMVPMGLPPAPPAPRGHPLRDRFEAIGPADPVLLWWGTVWRWLDAHSAIEAIAILAERRPDVRLVITAGRPADAATDPLNATEEARAAARERGLLGRNVFFLDEWVPFEDRHHYLADADLGICLHGDTPEAALAARSRYMDCVWASLPLILARGDEVADSLADAGAATLVRPRDPAAVAAAIDGLLARPDRVAAAREASRAVAAELTWPALLAPLVECLAEARSTSHSASDLVEAASGSTRYYARRAVDRGLLLG
jgi:glycosyltransferase involved in cell wall biosynthesis